MPRPHLLLLITSLLTLVMIGPVAAEGDPARGKTVFGRCAACHTTTEQNKVGPHLSGVLGRTAGTVNGFRYSKAMTESGTVWNEQTLDAFLAAPAKTLPGTSMQVALPNAADREDVIAYLKTLTTP
jgi:cytochrome c